ncbi:MAG: chemotaxis protein CheW [Thermodesulfobacteriota bacterium]
MEQFSAKMPWVIFRLLNEQFAVSADHIREMVAMPHVVEMPGVPDYVRGVINLRGKVIPVLDLRRRMGMRSLMTEVEDLILLLNQREQDHINWLTELEASVRDHREFKLTTDPHQCAFGRWYDNYSTDNRTLAISLKKFDAPHKKIHGIAVKIKEFESSGDFDSAINIIQQTRENELAEMVNLFAEVRLLIQESNREIALVLEWKDNVIAGAVDSVETVEKLKVDEIVDLPGLASTSANECIFGIAKRLSNKGMVQLLDVRSLIGSEPLPDENPEEGA